MPKYDYRCENCGTFEHTQSITADPLAKCPTCNGAVQRLISRNVNILFKGSGWHINDYRSPSYQEAAQAESSAASDGAGTSTE